MFQFRRFPSYAYLIQRRMTAYCAAGFPHSEIHGSMDICSSPWLIAACHVLLRLLMPRHSPCALSSLTSSAQSPLISVSGAASRLCRKLRSLPCASSSSRNHFVGFRSDKGQRKTWFSLRIMQASQEFFGLIVFTLHPFGCVPQLKHTFLDLTPGLSVALHCHFPDSLFSFQGTSL